MRRLSFSSVHTYDTPAPGNNNFNPASSTIRGKLDSLLSLQNSENFNSGNSDKPFRSGNKRKRGSSPPRQVRFSFGSLPPLPAHPFDDLPSPAIDPILQQIEREKEMKKIAFCNKIAHAGYRCSVIRRGVAKNIVSLPEEAPVGEDLHNFELEKNGEKCSWMPCGDAGLCRFRIKMQYVKSVDAYDRDIEPIGKDLYGHIGRTRNAYGVKMTFCKKIQVAEKIEESKVTRQSIS